jgi:hypothetical protein
MLARDEPIPGPVRGILFTVDQTQSQPWNLSGMSRQAGQRRQGLCVVPKSARRRRLGASLLGRQLNFPPLFQTAQRNPG